MTDSAADKHDASFHHRVANIVVEALDLEGAERIAFIESACGDDETLRTEVDALLADSNDSATEFLALPNAMQLANTWTVSPDGPGERKLPEQLGPYRILELLGAGGMGVVYLAELDEPVHRRVALKVVSTLTTSGARRRFTAECQALARLNHPNIAAMYETGILPGSADAAAPYVAMEYVEGEQLIDWCDARSADLTTRLRLFLGVCAGIRHAHEKGILHCDLKPSNILVTEVDGQPVAKVIDFGIARALDEPLLKGSETLTREMFLGSPLYVSPEAAGPGGRQNLDVRSDVYSLGLILYELLTGALPFDVRGLSSWQVLQQASQRQQAKASVRFTELDPEISRALATKRRTSPRRLIRALRGDLDAILSKATAMSPPDRYGSPAVLAAEVGRHLRQAPVAARGDSLPYLLSRFVGRNRGKVAAVVLLLLALVAGYVARTLEARRANAEAERARIALAESEQVRSFMIDLFEAADPERAAGERLTVPELLDLGAARLQEDLSDQPLTRARFLQTIGTIYTTMGLFPRAGELIAEALELRAAALPSTHPEVLESRNELGIIRRREGRLDEATKLLEGVLEARLATPDIDSELIALSYNNLGNLYWNQERHTDAEEAHRAALEIRSTNPATREPEAMSANNLGVLLLSQRRAAEALPFLSRAVELLKQELGPQNARVASAVNNLGLAERDLSSWANAEIHFREAVQIFDASLGPGHRRTLRPRRNLVVEMMRKHRWDDAVAEARAIVAVGEAAQGDPVERIRRLRFQGDVERRAGLGQASIITLEQTLELAESELGEEHPDTIHVRHTLARAWSEVGRHADATTALAEISAQQAETLPPEHRSRTRTEQGLGEVAFAAGRFEDALNHFQQVLEVNLMSFGERHRWTAGARFKVGSALAALGRDDEAATSLRSSLVVLQELLASDHPAVGDSAHELALVEMKRGHRQQARVLLEQAVSIRRTYYPEGDSDLAASISALDNL